MKIMVRKCCGMYRLVTVHGEFNEFEGVQVIPGFNMYSMEQLDRIKASGVEVNIEDFF